MSVSWLLSINGAAAVSPQSLGINMGSRNLASLAPSTVTLSRKLATLQDAPIMQYKDSVAISRVTTIKGCTTTNGSATLGLPAGTLPLSSTGGVLQAVIHNDTGVGFDFSCLINAWVDPSGNLYGTCSSFVDAAPLKATYNNGSGTVLHWKSFPITGAVNMATLHLTSLSGSGVCDPSDSSTPNVTLAFSIGSSIALGPSRPGVFGFGPTALNGSLSGGVSATFSGTLVMNGFFFDALVSQGSTASQVVSVASALSGTGIAANTVVSSLNGASSQLTMSHNATATGTIDITVTTQWFVGTCGQPEDCDASDTSQSESYTIYDAWWDLQFLPYTQQWDYVDGAAITSRVMIPAHVTGGTYNYAAGAAISTVSALSELLGWAATRADFTLGSISGSGMEMPNEEHSDAFVADLAHSILRYHPSAVSYFDYATTPPTLYFATDDDGIGSARLGKAMQLVQINANQSKQKLAPRYDLLFEGVVINFETKSQGQGKRISQQFYPTINPDDPPPGAPVYSMPVDEGTGWGSDTGAGQIAIPADLAQRIFEAHSTVQYQGGVSLKDADVGGRSLMGSVLAVHGGKPGWEGMRAWIQGVTEDLRTGATSISVGPKPTMGLADWRRVAAAHSARSFPGGKPRSQALRDTAVLPDNVLDTDIIYSPGVGSAPATDHFIKRGLVYDVEPA